MYVVIRGVGGLRLPLAIAFAPLLCAQHYCITASVTTSFDTAFKVGDVVAVTATAREGSKSCESHPETSQRICSANIVLTIQNGSVGWTNARLAPDSAQLRIISFSNVPQTIVTISGSGDSQAKLSPVTEELGVNFLLGYQSDLLSAGTFPATLPSPTTSVLNLSIAPSLSYKSSDCWGIMACQPPESAQVRATHFYFQQQPQWCWAAVSEMLMSNADGGEDVEQCRQASKANPGLNCCTAGKENMPSPCNRQIPLSTALDNYRYSCTNGGGDRKSVV